MLGLKSIHISKRGAGLKLFSVSLLLDKTLQSPILATVNYWHLQTYPGTWASQFASTIQFAGFVIREFGYLKAKAVSPALAVWTEINGRGTQRMCSFSAIGFGWIVLNNLGVVCLEMCIVPWWFRLDTGPQGGPYMGCSLGCWMIISMSCCTLAIVGWYWICRLVLQSSDTTCITDDTYKDYGTRSRSCPNIKTVFPRYEDSHFKDKTVVRPSYL